MNFDLALYAVAAVVFSFGFGLAVATIVKEIISIPPRNPK